MKTNGLTGAALDWAVAKCKYPELVWGSSIGIHHASHQIVIPHLPEPQCYWNPSTNWAQAGPIIERERIELCSYSNDGVDTAFKSMANERGDYSHEEEYVISVPEVVTWTAWVKYGSHKQDGPTPLIAAMRCYVASVLGDTIDIPEGLI